MFEFLKLQYEMGRINKGQLERYVPKWLSEDEKDQIVRGSEGIA